MSKLDDRPFVANARWFLDQAMTSGRYSSVLVADFDAHVENGTANIFPIFREIGILEGAETRWTSTTKPASQFKGKVLDGLWHKHYPQAGFQAENLRLHWSKGKIAQMVAEVLNVTVFDPLAMSHEIANRYVHRGLQDRGDSEKMTGEWIVFARQDGVAFYLTLGTHTEDDAAIWRRCRACAAEFPELAIIQQDRA